MASEAEAQLPEPELSLELANAYLLGAKDNMHPVVYARTAALLKMKDLEICHDPRSGIQPENGHNYSGGMIITARGSDDSPTQILQRAKIVSQPERSFENSFEIWQRQTESTVMHRVSGDAKSYTRRDFVDNSLVEELIVRPTGKNLRFISLRRLVNPGPKSPQGVYAMINYAGTEEDNVFLLVTRPVPVIEYQECGIAGQNDYYSYDKYVDRSIAIEAEAMKTNGRDYHVTHYGSVNIPRSITFVNGDIPAELLQSSKTHKALLRTLLHYVSFGYF